jgi:hypothetical protein
MSRRREEARTDETTLSEGMKRNIELEGISKFAQHVELTIDELLLNDKREHLTNAENKHFTKPNLEGATNPLEILKRTLSVRSVLSTHSSFAERMKALRNADPNNLCLAEIGCGSFGRVYEIPGTEWCLKKTLKSPEAMWIEFINGKKISQAVNNQAATAILQSEEFPDDLMPRVPRYLCSYGMEDFESTQRWFRNNGHMFPVENGGQKPGPVICLERIMPLPKLVRESLIQHYFNPEKQAAALADEKNKACICRAYLGCESKEIPPAKLEQQRETLQNFPLYLDQLLELEMDPQIIARDMALGLAAGHWAANIDMLDVEYVIGSRPFMRENEIGPISKADIKAAKEKSNRRVRNMSAKNAPKQQRLSFRNRAIRLWMIDFNKAETFDASLGRNYDKSIAQLVANTRSTDGPYYPRVVAKNEYQWKLWVCFARTYIRASQTILTETIDRNRAIGLSYRSKDEELVLKRPVYIINEWIKAEATEYGISSKQFKKMLQDNKWEMP